MTGRCVPVICGLVIAAWALAAPAEGQQFAEYSGKLQRNLNDNIVAFWTARCIDKQNGGYLINFDAQGKPSGKTEKMIVTQARMVWLFSRLAHEGKNTQAMLSDAEVGYRFLRDKMWDKKNGGFYWEVDASGNKHLMPQKHLYGESFALYALSEYAMATKRGEPLQLATQLFDLLDAKAHDSEYGGYRESFGEDWKPLTGGESVMGPVEFKLMNTHLHLLESMTAYYRASHSPKAYTRLMELIAIESNAVVRKPLMGCTDKYQRNWQPVLTEQYKRVSYGHDLENIWLLAEASEAAGISPYPLLDFFKAGFEDSYRYGFDQAAGGFFESGPFSKAADKKDKVWWVQAEACVSALYMYRLTGESRYWEVFTRTYDFVDKHQTDWQTGEWWPTVRDGKGMGGKADIWKAGYHNGRAMLECLAVLSELQKSHKVLNKTANAAVGVTVAGQPGQKR